MDPENRLVQKSLRLSTIEGGFSAVMLGFAETFFSAFAVTLGASTLQLGLIGSLPQALGALLQTRAANLLLRFGSRRSLVVLAALVQALFLLPLLVVSFLGIGTWIVVSAVCGYTIAGMFAGTVWNAWMGDLVPAKTRGAYFGGRNRIVEFFVLLSIIAGGLLLQHNPSAKGFFLVFILALLARIVSIFLLARQYDSPTIQVKTTPFSVYARQLFSSPFGRLSVFIIALNFFVFIAAPFFTPYMLTTLGLSWLLFTVLTAVSSLTKSRTLPGWGVLADRFGTKKVILGCSVLLSLVPLLWALSTNFWWLVFVQVLSGFSWGGFLTASNIMILEMTSSDTRISFISWHNLLAGVAILAGGFLGGFIVSFFGYTAAFVFSGIGRIVCVGVLAGLLIEVRAVSTISYQALFLRAFSTAIPTSGLLQANIQKSGSPQRPSLVLRLLDPEAYKKHLALHRRWRAYLRRRFRK